MILDIIILLLLVGGLISGYRAGLITQSVRIISLILAFVVAIYYFQATANMAINLAKKLGLTPGIQWLYVADIIAFVLLFAMTHAVYLMLGSYLNELAKIPGFHLGNALLGSLIGAVTQYLIVFFVLNCLIAFPISWVQTQYRSSQLSQWIVKETPVLSKHVTKSAIQSENDRTVVVLMHREAPTNEMG